MKYQYVNNEIVKYRNKDESIKKQADLELIRQEFYKIKNFFRLLLNPNDPTNYDIDDLLNGSIDVSTEINLMYARSSTWTTNAEHLQNKIKNIPKNNAWGSLHHNIDQCATLYENLDRVISAVKRLLESRKILFQIGDKNCFQPHTTSTSKVLINFSLYKVDGYSKNGGHYYISSVLDENTMLLGVKQKTLQCSIFHEFSHALHEIEGRRRSSNDTLSLLYKDQMYMSKWSNDEELLNIAGIFYENGSWFVDNVCVRCFDMSQTSCSSIDRMPRHLHTEPKIEEGVVLSKAVTDEKQAAEAIMKAHPDPFHLKTK